MRLDQSELFFVTLDNLVELFSFYYSKIIFFVMKQNGFLTYFLNLQTYCRGFACWQLSASDYYNVRSTAAIARSLKYDS